MIDTLAVERKRQRIARNTGACTMLHHYVNIDAHEAIKRGEKVDYVKAVYGVDAGAYCRIKLALASDEVYSTFNKLIEPK